MNEPTTELLEEAAYKFLNANSVGPVSFAPTSGGMNNFVYYCDCWNGERYIVRVYNNGRNYERVRFEHWVLQELKQFAFSYAIPEPLPSLDMPNLSHVLLTTGDQASVFKLIPGSSPNLAHAYELGRAAAELAVVLSKLTIDIPCPTAPYHEIYKVHHAATREVFLDTMTSSSRLNHIRPQVDFMLEQMTLMEENISCYLAQRFPRQIIHGDLVYCNALSTEGGTITGIIDFEFAAVDWRAMELAVGLSKYSNQEGSRYQLIDNFVRGYSERALLTHSEIKSIPELIILRLLSNIVYFLGRAVSGEDSWETLCLKICDYFDRITWINESKPSIISMIQQHFEKSNNLDHESS
jgi:homoserine kinase type II